MEQKRARGRSLAQPLPLRLHSRVRVRAVVIRAGYSRSQRRSLLKCLNAVGTVIQFDPRWTLPFVIRLDDGRNFAFAEDDLEVLEP